MNRQHQPGKRPPIIHLVFVYATFASLWIVLTDNLIFNFLSSQQLFKQLSIVKGLCFVSVTSLLLYGLLRRAASDASASAERERRILAEKLRTTNLLEAIANSSTDAIFAKDVHGGYTLFNKAAEHNTGKSAVEVLGKTDYEILLPEDAAKVMSDDQRIMNEKQTITFEHPLKVPKGDRVFLTTQGPLYDENGRVNGVFGIARDITERKRSEERSEENVKQLEASMETTLLAISHMVEARDPYTAGHERRVGIIAADIAKEMGWPENKCKELQMIGLVHDIGKIGVPAEILVKPSQLTDVEYRLAKNHVAIGYEILKDVKFPLPIAEIIYQHHERINGSGYPRGLKGNQILPEARILAVADVLESMASHRPYRPALSMEFTLNELSKDRGVLYAPDVVDALLRLVNDKGYQLPAN